MQSSCADKRLAIVAIFSARTTCNNSKILNILNEFDDIVMSHNETLVTEYGGSVLSITIRATTNELGAFTGKLGMLPAVKVKSIMFKELL
ncbi:MAG: hypothetical protein V3573_12915 [Desulfovibrionaceae bacterium]